MPILQRGMLRLRDINYLKTTISLWTKNKLKTRSDAKAWLPSNNPYFPMSRVPEALSHLWCDLYHAKCEISLAGTSTFGWSFCHLFNACPITHLAVWTETIFIQTILSRYMSYKQTIKSHLQKNKPLKFFFPSHIFCHGKWKYLAWTILYDNK